MPLTDCVRPCPVGSVGHSQVESSVSIYLENSETCSNLRRLMNVWDRVFALEKDQCRKS